MTESLQQQITREAEEKYPLYTTEELAGVSVSDYSWMTESNTQSRSCIEAHIAASVPWIEKLEAIREEVKKRMKDYLHVETLPADSPVVAGRYNEAKEILSIIDKHLNP